MLAFQTVLGHLRQDGFTLFRRAAERNHQDHIRQAHLFTNTLHRPAFQRETFAIFGVVVAGRAAPADHGVVFAGLKLLTTNQVGVFVRLEIGQANDHRPRIECRRNRCDAFCQPIHKELWFVVIENRHIRQFLLGGRIGDLIKMNQGKRMCLDVVGDDEFEPRQSDSIIGNFGEAEGVLRDFRHSS